MTGVAVAQHAKITDGEWRLIQPLFIPERGPKKAGRRRRDAREIASAIFWVLDTTTPWRKMPQSFPPWQTCHRWYLVWERDGTLDRAREILKRYRKRSARLRQEIS